MRTISMESSDTAALPAQVGVMLLGQLVLYPGAICPLYIFEERYRSMLIQALESDRMFAIAPADDESARPRVGCVGVVRACVTNDDGTSNLILQGVERVSFDSWTDTQPFPFANVSPLFSETDSPKRCAALREEVAGLAHRVAAESADLPQHLLQAVDATVDGAPFSDLVASGFVGDPDIRVALLQETSVERRLEIIASFLTKVVDSI